jgi:hypothetical protein
MKKILLGVFVVGFVFCVITGWAQEATRPAPEQKKPEAPAEKKPEITADQVLEKYVEMTGGRAAYEKITSSISKGTMEITAQNIRGTVETYSKAPTKFLLVQAIDGVGQFTQGYDGQMGWGQDPFLGLRNLEGAELANFKRDASFHSDLKWRELYDKVELVGTQKVGDRDAYVIRMTPSIGKPVTRYFDTETFLIVRSDVVSETPFGTLNMESYPSDYRVVDGVKMPFQLMMKAPSGEMVMKITEVKNNVDIDDAKFVKPAASGGK